MGQNRMDPRDPLSAAFYFTFINNARGGSQRGRGGTPSSGCGCTLLLGALIAALLIWSIAGGLTK